MGSTTTATASPGLKSKPWHCTHVRISDEEYSGRYGETRTDLQGMANCTDITFAEPPETAETWTSYDSSSLKSGAANASVYPSHAETRDSALIADAHATIFATHPSTIVHQNEEDTPLYVAPELVKYFSAR